MLRASLIAAVVAAAALAPAAQADSWLPHPEGATWTYEWTDSAYNPTPTREAVKVEETKGKAFTLGWTTKDQGNADGTVDSTGTVSFQETSAGLVNTDWSSNPPPQTFPILCAFPTLCNNSLASTYYNVIWGGRAPVIPEPLLSGSTWTGTGGAQGDVSSSSDYVGVELVQVPAFPEPVLAAKVRTDVTQAGALGDPYGSGVRTVWWVFGVGPVKVVFEHAGGDAPIMTSVLVATSLTAAPPPPDEQYFPLVKGKKLRYSWTNSKHLRTPSIQRFTVDEVVNGSARVSVEHVKGPIRVAGAYGFTVRGDGVTNIWAFTRSASLARFPQLGPRNLPENRRRRFATPFDLMTFGLNPILPAYPIPGATWSAKVPSRDFSIFGVRGETKVLGVQRVEVPGGTFDALAVRTKLVQPGFAFGSGTRTSYFAPDKGLVKLVFRHADGSVSTVQLLK